jgi:RNA polymerase sigma-70 factor (ECF subfamily)
MSIVAPEQELWQGLCQGDAAAFEELYRRHAGHLRAFLRRYLSDAHSAQDITQEVFLALWRNPQAFDPRRGTLRRYIFGIGRKRAADWWRRQPREGQTGPVVATGSGEADVALAEVFGQLDPDTRALLWLREVEGYSNVELAEILGGPCGHCEVAVVCRPRSAPESLAWT